MHEQGNGVNGWLRVVVGIGLALVLGAYGYTRLETGALRGEIETRLTRIETKLDALLFQDRRPGERWR